MSVLGPVGQVPLPRLVLLLTMDPTKPHLCHDASFLNLWMVDVLFKLDSIVHLSRYVSQESYQTVPDDKSGYNNLFLAEASRTYFRIQWGGQCFVFNTLPFGWKSSPFIYHSIGLVATNFFHSLGVPCLLYIDDPHNGQLQVDLTRGPYSQLETADEHNLVGANSAIFLVSCYLVQLVYFLGLFKSIFCPAQVVPYLGFLSDSVQQAFHLILVKKEKFLIVACQILASETCRKVFLFLLQSQGLSCLQER